VAGIAERLADALDVRTSTFHVDIPSRRNGELSLDRRGMRSRFAMLLETNASNWAVRLGSSRCRPRSTLRSGPSCSPRHRLPGGLDFHLWCHSVVHWNFRAIPSTSSNAKGGVHRFKGMPSARTSPPRSVPRVGGGSGDVWDVLFAQPPRRAQRATRRCSLLGLQRWPAKIQRSFPCLVQPRCRSAPRLRKSLAAYRLAFGQPARGAAEYLGGGEPRRSSLNSPIGCESISRHPQPTATRSPAESIDEQELLR